MRKFFKRIYNTTLIDPFFSNNIVHISSINKSLYASKFRILLCSTYYTGLQTEKEYEEHEKHVFFLLWKLQSMTSHTQWVIVKGEWAIMLCFQQCFNISQNISSEIRIAWETLLQSLQLLSFHEAMMQHYHKSSPTW